MYGSEGIANFQFHQSAPGEITLWIVPGTGDPEAREQKIRDAIRQIQALTLGHEIRIDVRHTDAIPLSREGKHRFTRSAVMEDSHVA